jgi:hypothetical protein
MGHLDLKKKKKRHECRRENQSGLQIMNKVHYYIIHIWKFHNEIHYFSELIYAKEKGKM